VRRRLVPDLMQNAFRALVVSETPQGGYTRTLQQRRIDELPAGEVLIRVRYSSLNYKDALSASGNRGVTRHYPHTPGIDAAGVVESSASAAFRPGDPVVCTGYDLGVNTAGGFAEYIRVPADWLVPLPAGLSLRESMILGTAGFTAALCLYRLQQHEVTPAHGELIVTGATGGVGSVAFALLADAGYRVVASTGKTEQHDFLKRLGAREVIGRDALDDRSDRPLLSGRWAGAVDTVGGHPLAHVLRSLKPHGVATCCGLVASPELHTTVYPFILRGVTLIGVDSSGTAMPLRRTIWSKLAGEWKLASLDTLARDVSLDQLEGEIERILKGAQVGRVLVSLQ
jgi:acrylyl-CoA reductase (NADPH)